MDKADFLRTAPAYYELAVLDALRRKKGYLSEEALQDFYTVNSDPNDPSDFHCYIENVPLLQYAIERLSKTDAIEALLDDFGPPQYKAGEGHEAYMDEQRANKASPTFKSEASSDSDRWLRSALSRVNQTYRQLGLTQADFENPEADWAPIPIERSNKALLEAEAAVDKTIEEVEKNNGYADQHPEERNFVLDNLKLLSAKFKTGTTTSVAYVKIHGLEALKKVANRFAGMTASQVANVAIQALLRWLGIIP